MKALYQQKKHAYRKAVKHPSNDSLQQQFRILRAKTDKLNTFLRNKYFVQKCAAQHRDIRSHWKLINSVVNRIKPRPPPAAEIDDLNSYFHDIVTDLDRPSILCCPFGPPVENAFSCFSPVTQLKVLQVLSTLDVTKAAGPDSIPTSIIKSLAPELSPGLANLFNHMLQSGSLPEQFRMAYVTPVHKKGNPATASNYRPISLLPILSKVLERLVFDQLTTYIENNPELEILPKQQFAYRRGHSTEDALTLAVDHWSRSIDRGQQTAVCFVDMSKAFDRVSHQLLLQELHSCGITSVALEWFREYLSNRTQAVRVGNDIATTVQVTRGVPQGSVLGPLLYSIYVRSIPALLQRVTTIQYADDICFFTHGTDPNVLSETLSSSLDDLDTFLQSRSLLLNTDKTQVMILSSARTQPMLLTVELNGKRLEQVDHAKYLGLNIDQHLTFATHVEKTVSKIAGLTYALRRHRRKLDIRSRRMYYLTLIQPHLEYASNAFCNLLSSQLLTMLTVAANNGIRAVFGLPDWAHVSPLYSKLRIAPLHQRYLLKCYVSAYKCSNNISPVLLCNRFLLNARPHNVTRQTTFSTFKLPHVNTQIGLNSFSFLAADRFNGLPVDLRSAPNLAAFVLHIKEFIGYPRKEGH